MMFARWVAVVSAHSGWTDAAASIACCISSRPLSGRVASTSPFAGFMTLKVLPDAAEPVHSPPTNRLSIMLVSIIFPPGLGLLRCPRHPSVPGRHGIAWGAGREEAHHHEGGEARQEAAVDRAVGQEAV